MISKNKKTAILTASVIAVLGLTGFTYNQELERAKAETRAVQQANEDLMNRHELQEQVVKDQASEIEALRSENAELSSQIEELEAHRSQPAVSRGSYGSELGVFEFTAYETGGYCANGMPAQPGVIAVDPSVIPLGSQVYIEVDGMPEFNGVYTAADTGGAVNGNIIDVCMESGHYQFGRRSGRAWIVG